MSANAVAGEVQVVPGLPATNRLLVAESVGRSFRSVAEVVEEPLPMPGRGEVLVRVRFAGINGGCETFRARGEHAFAANRRAGRFPLGAEGAGVVVAVGPGGARAGVTLGSAVALGGNEFCFAEYVVARSSSLTVLKGPPSAEAVALVLSGVTACVALEATAQVAPGEAVAVSAAAGGTGHLAVQIALLGGASAVVALCGSDEKADALRALCPRGRVIPVNHRVARGRAGGLLGALRAACPAPAGFDVVYEGVGGRVQAALLACLAPRGRLLQVGYISEYPHELGYPELRSESGQPSAAERQASSDGANRAPAPGTSGDGLPDRAALMWHGLHVPRGDQTITGAIWPRDPRAIARARRRVFKLHEEGDLQVWIDRSHALKGLESIPDAVEHMLKGDHLGKVVVELCDA